MNTCTFPRMQALRIGLALLAASSGLPLAAQTAQTARIHSSGAQSNLRIEVNVVPAVAVHHRDKDKDEDKDKDKDRDRKDGAAVTYNLNPQHEELSVSEEMRPMQVESGKTVQQEQVRSITVVPK